MKKKVTKQLRRMAEAIGFNKPPQERKKIYKRLKNVHKWAKSK